MRKASSSLLSTAEHMSSDPWSALTRSQKICGPATPSFPQSESWWCFLVWELHSPQDFPFSPLHSDFPSVPPFSSDPWICKVIMGRKDTYWHCVGSPLKLFKVEFPVTVVVKPRHHSFHLTDRKSFLFLFTWVGVIVLFIIWNSFLVMNPSLSLSSACKARHITMNCELTSKAKRPNGLRRKWSKNAIKWKWICRFMEYLERECRSIKASRNKWCHASWCN